MSNSPGQEDDSKIYLNLIIEITNSNFEVFLFSEAPLRISKVQLSFPFSFLNPTHLFTAHHRSVNMHTHHFIYISLVLISFSISIN